MKLLLTSGGVTNPAIREALIDLLGRPIEECDALFIPTAQWGQPMCSPQSVWRSSADGDPSETGLVGLGWRSVGILELTALPTIDEARWRDWVRNADVLLVDGGEAIYLVEWIRRSGLGDVLPSLTDTVWVGVSAGSMALTPRVGSAFLDWRPDGDDRALGLVDFSIFPHLDYPGWSENTTESARRWATGIDGPAYAIDDDTAIAVVNGTARVVSEGHWEQLDPSLDEVNPSPEASETSF
ncbi:dipeptidase E [Labedella gwakjiensis]|uniref:Peptidase E n=1 Tax=Labedella gwakjiensis TaxID=390269 RepID=A0A2P8GVY7_9MICO|nr:Type 1 glutamine amidotransferase-like domain-containing protein [Labedella gwakjiensis]PSL38124.1 dipeptidase E [Labedella gwakjiensis]RUQ87326.1 peptidase E [Labedella gwakjiensis]